MNTDQGHQGHWLTVQVAVAARRLASSSPKSLSPTGRSLQEVAAAWVRDDPSEQVVAAQNLAESPELKIVHETAKRQIGEQTQLPLISSVPDH